MIRIPSGPCNQNRPVDPPVLGLEVPGEGFQYGVLKGSMGQFHDPVKTGIAHPLHAMVAQTVQ